MMIRATDVKMSLECRPRELFGLAGFTNLTGFGIAAYDVDPVTGRLLMAVPRVNADATEEPVAPHVKVVLNWLEELRQRVPTGR